MQKVKLRTEKPTPKELDISPNRQVSLGPLDVARIRKDFPILDRQVRGGKPLVYLDNAASSQKPTSVIDSLTDYYTRYNANVHRGIHTLSEEATDEYEKARRKIQNFINAKHTEELIRSEERRVGKEGRSR